MGSSLGFPLPWIWNCLLHSGHVILPRTPLVRWIPFRQWRQKLCKQGSCFGSVNVHIHTEQDTSSWRLSSKVFISIPRSENKVNFGLSKERLFGRSEPTLLWPRQKLTNQNEPLHFVEMLTCYILFFSELLISALKHELLTCQENLSHLILHHFFQPLSGAPNVNFSKISVRKTIWDLQFSEHLL